MPTIDIRELQTILRQRQAKWSPIETPISRLPDEQQKKMLGVVVPPGFQLQTATAEVTHPVANFAPSVDWRNKNGNHVTAVKQQGGCGSCVSLPRSQFPCH